MKVYAGKSSAISTSLFQATAHLLLIAALALASVLVPVARATSDDNGDERKSESRDKLFRDAKKAMRAGRYEDASKLYVQAIKADGRDTAALLGSSFAHLKLQDYVQSFDRAMEALKIEPNNARAHALAGSSLLRSGFVRAAIAELQRSLDLDPKEALAYGAAAEVDYYEGRPKESRERAFYAHNLDPDEPDYLITYARAASRLEDFNEAADAYEAFLQIAPLSDTDRRDRIKGLIQFYRQLSGIQIHQVSGDSVTEAPFHLGSDRRPYLQIKLNGRDALFVIDTGSGFTVISKDAARRFGISEIAKGGKSQGVGGSGKFPIVYGLIKSVQIGGVRVRMVPCFIRPFHGANDHPPEERAEGFIGLSILSRFLTELDYKNALIRLDRSENRGAPMPPAPGVTVTPFRTTQNGLISVETEFEGNQLVNAIIDSGASSTVLSQAAVERLKLRDQIIKGQTTSVIGAAGVTENVEMLLVRKCRVADAQQVNLRALVLDFGAINETSGFEQGGIIGGDFLRHYRLTIDFNRAVLALTPHTPPTTNQ